MVTNISSDPQTFKEAMSSVEAAEWKCAIQEEYNSMLVNKTWELSVLPRGRKALNTKWVLKKKYGQHGEVERFKARLVVKGCSQREGLDFNETFSPVIRYETVRFLIAMAAKFDLQIDQMDAVTAFLQGDLEEEIYIKHPEATRITVARCSN